MREHRELRSIWVVGQKAPVVYEGPTAEEKRLARIAALKTELWCAAGHDLSGPTPYPARVGDDVIIECPHCRRVIDRRPATD